MKILNKILNMKIIYEFNSINMKVKNKFENIK